MGVGTSNPFFAEPYALRRWKRGPLSPYLDRFAKRLHDYGYSPSVGQDYIRCIGYLSLWLEHQGLGASVLDEHKIGDHIKSLKRHKGVAISSAPHRLFLSYLREMGIIKRSPPQTMSKVVRIVNEYVDYLRHERGLAEATLAHRRLFPRRFLEERFGKKAVRLSQLEAQDFIRYIRNHAHEYGALYRSNMVLVLKDFCRFLHLRGYVHKDIASSIPRMPSWKPVQLPAHLERSDVERLLKTCKRDTPKGMRDYAILLLLVRLGLRAGEVRSLTLDDIDWEAGQIIICGKGGKRNRLPLPQDVGRALVQYLQHGRPPCSSRHVFIRTRAPHTGFQCSGPITKIVKQALERTGLNPPHKGSHLLRHTFATHLLRSGASLPEISRMLGHENPSSTLVYAHIDMNKLRQVSQPWPGGVS
jgi:site-specific recombinase XerD